MILFASTHTGIDGKIVFTGEEPLPAYEFLDTDPLRQAGTTPIMNDRSGREIVRLQQRQVQYFYALGALAVISLISLLGFLYASLSKQVALSREKRRRRRLEKRLFQSQKMEAVGHLTGGMVHDFNNLLAVILGNVDILEDGLADRDGTTKSLDRIRRSAERGSYLVQRMLSFASNQPLKPELVNLNNLITDITGILCQTLDESIIIDTHFEDSSPVMVDAAQMENALLNLAINAQDAMKDGGRLTIETTCRMVGRNDMTNIPEIKPGPYVIVAVSDTGIGMSEDTLAHVFEPFYTNKGMAGHSGLGLNMVRGFIKQSGGHTHIDSQEGVGTSIKLYLPKATDPQPVEREAVQPEGNGQTILVVEDNPDVRDLTVSRLRDLGYEVLDADDGISGLAVLNAAPNVNMLFTDVILPGGMSGPDMAKEAISRHPSIKVVYMSGYTAETLIEQGKLSRGTMLLCKPFQKHDLAQSIDEAFHQPPSHGSGQRQHDVRFIRGPAVQAIVPGFQVG